MKTETPGEPGHWYQLAIVSKTTAEMLGDIAFKRLESDHAQAEIGFTLSRHAQGKGYALEAVLRLFEYLFMDLGLHRVFANCDPENLSSARLMQHAGMRHEGRFIESLWYKGRWASEDWYAILRREWENLRR